MSPSPFLWAQVPFSFCFFQHLFLIPSFLEIKTPQEDKLRNYWSHSLLYFGFYSSHSYNFFSTEARISFAVHFIPYPLLFFYPLFWFSSVQFSRSVVSDSLRSHESQHARPPCPSPTPGVHQTHDHRVSDAIQPSHPLSSPSPPAPNPSQHQSLFQWVSSSHEVAKVLEYQL